MKFARNLAMVLVLAVGCVVAGQEAKPDQSPKTEKKQAKALRDESRVWIVRNLQSEFGTLRKALPRGKNGLPLDAEKGVDERELLQRITDNGPAMRPGDLAQITKIEFRRSQIIFEINGGGKTKRHWYEGIQVGMGGPNSGPVTSGTTTGPAIGSSIELSFAGSVPDLTADDLRKLLSPVLDFTRRSAAVIFTETLPKETQEAIKNHQVTVGMDKDLVLASRGRPDRKIRETKRGVETEDWIYGVPPSKITIVTFDGDKVTEVKEYTPGVADKGVPVATDAEKAAAAPPDKAKPIPITSPRPDKP